MNILEPRDGGWASGYAVDIPALNRYAENTATMADELERLAKQKVNSVRDIAEDSFGKLGKESGFAAALNHFAGALEHQVNGVAANSNRFGRAVGRVASQYHELDADSADEFRNVERPRPGGRGSSGNEPADNRDRPGSTGRTVIR